MTECTLKTHAADLDRVIAYLRKKGFKKIFAIGHSYGGPTILLSKKKDFDGVVLWDASHHGIPPLKSVRYIKELDAYRARWQAEVIIGKAMIKEEGKWNGEELVRTIHTPIKIIVAGDGMLIKGGRAYYKSANPPKAFSVIKGAGHSFNEDGAEEKLFKETLGWLKKWS